MNVVTLTTRRADRPLTTYVAGQRHFVPIVASRLRCIRESVEIQCHRVGINKAQTFNCVRHAIGIYRDLQKSASFAIREGRELAIKLSAQPDRPALP